jgi:hypothetical protein
MLSDPLIISVSNAITSTGGTTANFRRTAIGRYIAMEAPFSSDQPARLLISPNVKKQGDSVYLVRYELDRNVAPVNGVQQSDDTLKLEIKLSGNLRSFSATDFLSVFQTVSWMIIQNMARIIGGEP